MSITWSKVATIAFLYSGCGAQAVTCMGGGRMLATVEEVGAPSPPGFVVARLFRSTDDGQTWAEIPAITSEENLSRGRLRPLGVLDHVLLGLTGPQLIGDYEAGASVIVRSLDGGDSWVSSVTNAEYIAQDYGNDGYDTLDFIITDFGTHFALGAFGIAGASYLISTDGGATFTTPSTFSGVGTFGSFAGAYLGSNVLIAGDTAHVPIRIFRSVDQAGTWTPVDVGTAGQAGTITGACPIGALGSGGALLSATRSTPSLAPRAYFSSDAGATWNAAAISGSAQGAIDVIAPSASFAVLGLDVTAAQMAAGGSPFRLSTDGGQTFSDQGTQANSFFAGVGYRVKQLAIADDGAVIAVVQTTDVTNTAPNEIWRGVIDGFSGPGPCFSFVPPPPAAALLGTHLLCIPTLSPQPCPQLCPVDPVQPLGQLVIFGMPGGGWLDPLGVVDLVDTVAIPGLLGRPTACGATFANNHCVGAGC